MELIEIIVIIVASLTVVSVIINSIIRRKKGKTSCGCDCSKCGRSCYREDKEKDHN